MLVLLEPLARAILLILSFSVVSSELGLPSQVELTPSPRQQRHIIRTLHSIHQRVLAVLPLPHAFDEIDLLYTIEVILFNRHSDVVVHPWR